MAIRTVDPIQGFDAVRAAVANATTTRKSIRPAGASTQPQRGVAASDPGANNNLAATEVKQSPESQMRFHVDQDTGKTVVALVDPESGEVLRQMPTAEALEVAKAIGKFQGMFVNLKV
jgi:flagellar protein FlaG